MDAVKSMDYFISLELERKLSSALLAHFIIASLFNFLAVYCLLRKTAPNQSAVRNHLLLIQAILLFLDLLMDILIEIIPLFPIPALYCIGLLSRAGVHMRFLLALSFFAVALLSGSIVLCFLHKHQTIVDTSSVFKLEPCVYNLFRAACGSTCLFFFAAGLLWPVDFEKSDRVMTTYAVNLSWIRERGDYLVLEKTEASQIGAYIFIGTALAFMIGINCSYLHLVYFLNIQKSKSIATRRMIKRSVVTLYIQLFAPSFVLAAPVCANVIFIATGTGDFKTCLALYFTKSLHSLLHSLILLLITPNYRAFLLSLFLRNNGQEESPSASHVNTSSARRNTIKSGKL